MGCQRALWFEGVKRPSCSRPCTPVRGLGDRLLEWHPAAALALALRSRVHLPVLAGHRQSHEQISADALRNYYSFPPHVQLAQCEPQRPRGMRCANVSGCRRRRPEKFALREPSKFYACFHMWESVEGEARRLGVSRASFKAARRHAVVAPATALLAAVDERLRVAEAEAEAEAAAVATAAAATSATARARDNRERDGGSGYSGAAEGRAPRALVVLHVRQGDFFSARAARARRRSAVALVAGDAAAAAASRARVEDLLVAAASLLHRGGCASRVLVQVATDGTLLPAAALTARLRLQGLVVGGESASGLHPNASHAARTGVAATAADYALMWRAAGLLSLVAGRGYSAFPYSVAAQRRVPIAFLPTAAFAGAPHVVSEDTFCSAVTA